MYPRLNTSDGLRLWDESVCTAQERLGWLLLELDARAKSRPVAAGGTAWKKERMDDIEKEFFKHVGTAEVKFECSMLQTQFTDGSGQLTWRSVSCEEDEDDFAQMWSKPWRLTDVVDGDEILWLPSAMPAGWTPVSMVKAWDEIKDCAPKVAKTHGIALAHKDSEVLEQNKQHSRWDTQRDTLVL